MRIFLDVPRDAGQTIPASVVAAGDEEADRDKSEHLDVLDDEHDLAGRLGDGRLQGQVTHALFLCPQRQDHPPLAGMASSGHASAAAPVLSEIKNRGTPDVLMVVRDGLTAADRQPPWGQVRPSTGGRQQASGDPCIIM